MGKPKGTVASPLKMQPKPTKKTLKVAKKPAMASKGDRDDKGDKGLINRSIEEMKQGVSTDECEARDKGKALKYTKLKEAGALPQHIISLVENESKKATSSRQFKTMAINRLFQRDEDGIISLATGDSLFQESQEIFTQTYAKKKEKALPRSIIQGLYFQNDAKSFEAALASGDLEECEEDGRKFYSFKEYTVAKVEGKTTKHKMQTECGVDVQEQRELQAVFAAVGWTMMASKTKKKLENTAMVNEEGGLTDPAVALITKAQESQSKLQKAEGMQLLKSPKLTENKSILDIKKGCAMCMTFSTQLAQIVDFQVLPDGESISKAGLDAFLKTVAEATRDFNEKLEVTKGLLRSKSN
ncbi:unnamed protein product [Symbiodinium sp. CCMP2592]|nr:unnamed protein product [Symbiodinium sp. CCMP2592]CAE7809921.1 unnamed protein product [Symbiodinium sp. CCMP2592]